MHFHNYKFFQNHKIFYTINFFIAHNFWPSLQSNFDLHFLSFLDPKKQHFFDPLFWSKIDAILDPHFIGLPPPSTIFLTSYPLLPLYYISGAKWHFFFYATLCFSSPRPFIINSVGRHVDFKHENSGFPNLHPPPDPPNFDDYIDLWTIFLTDFGPFF